MRATRKALFIALILMATLLPFTLAIGDPGWLSGWDYRVKITIDSGDIDSALTDFPILIYISDVSGINGENVSFVFDEVGANSLKIAVTLSDGTTECYVEVDKWDLGNRKAWIWAKIASINNITDTDLYLYYDNDHADNNANVGIVGSDPGEAVWDDNFILVTHMRDNPDNANIMDSTQYDNDGAKKGANEPIVTTSGEIDDAQDFDGSDDYVTVNGASLDDIDTFLTVEAWIKTPGAPSADAGVVDKWASSGYLFRHAGTAGVSDHKMFAQRGGGSLLISTTVFNDNVMRYIAFTVDGTNDILYVNAVSEDSNADSDAITTNAGVLRLGGRQTLAASSYFNGIVDEVRVSNNSRSPAWITGSYESERDNLLDYGSEEERSLLETPVYLFGAGFNGSSPHVSLYWTTNLTGINLFEIQNSTDKVSWDTLGSNTTAEYHDFQVVNGTERYYRVRACNYTGAAWDNSTFTDINFETVYFVEAAANGDTYVTGSIGIFLIALIIIAPIIYYLVRKR